jgi:hypothetical protein
MNDTPAPADERQAFEAVMRPMESDDGRKGWYIGLPEFYCEIERARDGTWAVFFRDKEGREAYGERASPAAEPKLTDADVTAMVDRFLGWKLPKDFCPDCGVSFDGRKDDEWNKNKTWPTGTNLLTAEQAKAMFEYALGIEAASRGKP